MASLSGLKLLQSRHHAGDLRIILSNENELDWRGPIRVAKLSEWDDRLRIHLQVAKEPAVVAVRNDEVIAIGCPALDLTPVPDRLWAHAHAAWDLVHHVAPREGHLGDLVALGHGLRANDDLAAVSRATLREV